MICFQVKQWMNPLREPSKCDLANGTHIPDSEESQGTSPEVCDKEFVKGSKSMSVHLRMRGCRVRTETIHASPPITSILPNALPAQRHAVGVILAVARAYVAVLLEILLRRKVPVILPGIWIERPKFLNCMQYCIVLADPRLAKCARICPCYVLLGQKVPVEECKVLEKIAKDTHTQNTHRWTLMITLHHEPSSASSENGS